MRYPSTWTDSRKWIRIEFYGRESSGDNIRDGVLDIKKLSETNLPMTYLKNGPWSGNIKTRADSGEERWRYVVFENYWGNISSGTGTKEAVYFDDIYIQTGTQARVEIGDSATWAGCKHREIQKPSAWSDTAITITLNKGSFKDGDCAFLYVVDANGNVNSNGYKLSGGAACTGGTSSPSAPTGLHIAN
jgi:hypothetical protein